MAQYQINKYAYALNLELTFTLISQNISNNTSVVRVLGRVVGTGNGEGAWGGAGRTGTITFNGVTESFNSGKDYNFPNATAVNHVLFQKDYTVAHNADGTKSVSGSITWKHDNAYFNSNAGTNTASVSITNQTLTTIPRASSFTLGGATQTNASISVTISRASTAFTHRVRWRVGSGSWINVASAATTSASFTVQPGNMPNLKTATITVGVQTYNGTTAIGSEATATRTITIPNSTISISGTANTGSAQTVNITNSGGSLSYTRSWKLGSATGGNVASWTPPHSALPSATSGTLTCTVTTKNGTATINTVSATRTITVPTSVLPTFTAITHSEAVSDVNTKVGAYVQNKTKLTLGVTNPVAGSGSSIKSYAISVAGHTVGNGGTTGVITQSGTLTITATVTDNRNRTATKTTTISVLAYENPTITGVSFTRSNSDGTPNTTGTYLTIKATVKVRRLLVGSVEKNKINYQSQSAQKGGSYTTKTNLANQAGTVSGNYRQAVYTHTFDTTDPTHGGYHVDYPYDVRVRGGDIFSWSGYIAGGIPTGVVLQHWGEETTAFGKMIDDVNYNVLVGSKGLKSDGPIVAGKGINIPDTRSVVSVPGDLPSNAISFEFKQNSSVGNPPVNASSSYSHIINVAGWNSNEGSGGFPTQISVGGSGLAVRQATSATAWGPWKNVGGISSVSWSDVTGKPANSQFPNTAQAIGASQNLNNYTTPGFYYQSANANASTSLNYPVAQAGTLIVTKDAGTTQMYYHYNGSGIFYRTLYGSTWTAWQNLLTPTWANVSGKPSTFAPSSHTHTWAQVTGKPARFVRIFNGSIAPNATGNLTESVDNFNLIYVLGAYGGGHYTTIFRPGDVSATIGTAVLGYHAQNIWGNVFLSSRTQIKTTNSLLMNVTQVWGIKWV